MNHRWLVLARSGEDGEGKKVWSKVLVCVGVELRRNAAEG
jgi:hypothetical protein